VRCSRLQKFSTRKAILNSLVIRKPFPADSFDPWNQLEEGAQFLVECFNEDLFFALGFATKYVNPYIVIGWSNRLLHRIAGDRQAGYMRMLRQAALACNAA